MKSSPKIPAWPVYVADALMFAAVFAVVLPNIYTGEPLSASAVFWCALMVLGGLLLCLAPYYMSLKDAEREEKAAADAKVQDDLRIIFDELAALRMMIADIEERMEPLPERLQAAAEAAEKIPSLASRDELAKLASDVRAAVKEKLSQLGESLDSAAAEIEACRSSQKDSDKIVAELCSDVAILKDLLPESSDSLADEIFSLKSRLEEVEGAAAAFAEKSGPRDGPADGGDGETFDEPPSTPFAARADGMLSRALAASENSKGSVEKFISISKPEPAPSEGRAPSVEPEPATVDSVRREFEKIADGIASGADGFPPDPDFPETPAQPPETSVLPSGGEPAVEPEAQKPEGETGFFESQDSPSAPGESQSAEPESPTLFELPEIPARAQKPAKGEASVTVNALIGIGNKPYLRGSGGGLSPDRGVAMEYVEIGKWRHVFADADAPIEFSVLKNDEIPSDGGETFVLRPSERLELNLSFPL